MYNKKSDSIALPKVFGLIMLIILLCIMFFLLSNKILPGRERINKIGDDFVNNIDNYNNEQETNFKKIHFIKLVRFFKVGFVKTLFSKNLI